MDTFIEKNEKLLRFYSVALRLSGWFLFQFSICSSVIFIVLARNYDAEAMLRLTFSGSLTIMTLGLFGIGLSQLVRYLFDSDYKPGLLLRHGDKLIYAYAIYTLIVAAIHIADFIRYLRMSDVEVHILFLANSITFMVYFIAKALILIGVAQILRRLMPIMAEQKSLI